MKRTRRRQRYARDFSSKTMRFIGIPDAKKKKKLNHIFTQLLEKLLQSKDPNDLIKANKLIKRLVVDVSVLNFIFLLLSVRKAHSCLLTHLFNFCFVFVLLSAGHIRTRKRQTEFPRFVATWSLPATTAKCFRRCFHSTTGR